MMAEPRKRIPDFRTDEEAAEFWDTHDSTEYEHDTEPVEAEFPPPRLKQACLRLHPLQIERLKRTAAHKGIGYQTMLRMWITERERQEREAQPGLAAAAQGKG
jgi:predicted DNA binding CopG/RHH family protein